MRPNNNNAPERLSIKKEKIFDRKKRKAFLGSYFSSSASLDPGDEDVRLFFVGSFFLFSFFPSRRIIKVETLPSSF